MSALKPEAYREQLERFRAETDTRIVIRFVDSGRESSKVGLCRYNLCDCVDRYEITGVIAAPEGKEFRPGGPLRFHYACEMPLGSFFPWSRKDDGGREIMEVPSRFLFRDDDGIWHLTGPYRPVRRPRD